MRRIAPAILTALWVLTIHMVLLASSAPVERHLRVHATDWPRGAPTQRLVLLSDLHVSTPGDSAARLAGTIARVNALRPDLVVITGDFVSTGTLAVRAAGVQEATAPLAAIRARLGTVAIFGNHDYYDDGLNAELRAWLPARGITLIENQAIRRGPFALIGLGDAYTHHAHPKLALNAAGNIGGWPILLTHGPDIVTHIPNIGGLVLTGHTHCGQIVLPVVGAPYVPSAHKRYRCGVVQDGPRVSITTAGLGVSNLPFRLGAPPDYWVVDVGP
jgi:predicted MPP superfamily phosphohydrolase